MPSMGDVTAASNHIRHCMTNWDGTGKAATSAPVRNHPPPSTAIHRHSRPFTLKDIRDPVGFFYHVHGRISPLRLVAASRTWQLTTDDVVWLLAAFLSPARPIIESASFSATMYYSYSYIVLLLHRDNTTTMCYVHNSRPVSSETPPAVLSPAMRAPGVVSTRTTVPAPASRKIRSPAFVAYPVAPPHILLPYAGCTALPGANRNRERHGTDFHGLERASALWLENVLAQHNTARLPTISRTT